MGSLVQENCCKRVTCFTRDVLEKRKGVHQMRRPVQDDCHYRHMGLTCA